MAEPQLHVFNPDTGETIPVEKAESELASRLHSIEEDLAEAERDNRKLKKRIKTLETDRERHRLEYVKRQEVEDIFHEWQELSGSLKSKLDGERFDAIKARIEDGYVRDEFRRAIAGGVYDPFVTDQKNGKQKKHNDIELICRTAKRFEAARDKAPRATSGAEPLTNRDDGRINAEDESDEAYYQRLLAEESQAAEG